MVKEFNLSEKNQGCWDGENYFSEEDIKEFIKELKENKVCSICKDNPCNCGEQDWVVGLDTIKEIAGDKLI